jgi:hypothetical protein
MCQHSAASHQLISFARLVHAFSRANAATAVIRPKHVLECIHGASTTVGQNNHSCRESTVRALVSATTHSVSGLAGILPTAEFVCTRHSLPTHPQLLRQKCSRNAHHQTQMRACSNDAKNNFGWRLRKWPMSEKAVSVLHVCVPPPRVGGIRISVHSHKKKHTHTTRGDQNTASSLPCASSVHWVWVDARWAVKKNGGGAALTPHGSQA